MAVNKDSNGYTFGFAIALVVVVGVILAGIALWTKPFKQKNDVVKNKLAILKAMLDTDKLGIDRSNAEVEFEKYVNLDNAIVINAEGQIVEGIMNTDGAVEAGKAFDVDIKKEFRDKQRDEKFRNYPLFLAKDGEKTLYVIPVVGKGLWGPIWGNVCIGEDMKTIVGASFDHKSETPGLGAEIKQQFFINRWLDEKISNEAGEFTPFKVVKDNSGAGVNGKVDGITGGTITSKGVEEMVNRCMQPYAKYFKSKL